MKKLIALLVSVAVVLLLYYFIDFRAILSVLARTDLFKLGLSLLLLIALIFASAFRLTLLGRSAGMPIEPAKAIEATFAANAINLFVPGKLGDVLKASLLAHDDTGKLGMAVGLGVWEKISELAMLMLIAAISFAVARDSLPAAFVLAVIGLAGTVLLLFAKPFELIAARVKKLQKVTQVWSGLVGELTARPLTTALLIGMSAFIWIGHLLQIAIMMSALGVTGDQQEWLAYVARLPIAIVAGLIPLTFAGIGTRDAALVLLFSSAIGPEKAAALGILFWLRYLVPGLLGMPLLPKFFSVSGKHAATLRRR